MGLLIKWMMFVDSVFGLGLMSSCIAMRNDFSRVFESRIAITSRRKYFCIPFPSLYSCGKRNRDDDYILKQYHCTYRAVAVLDETV